MSFPHHCQICPMKFRSEDDLQVHGQVHAGSSYASNYDFDSSMEPLFNEFLTAFFPNLNDSYIPSLNDFSSPDDCVSSSVEWDDPSCVSSSDDDITYTALKNVAIPCDVPENGEYESPNFVNMQGSAILTENGIQRPDENQASANVFIQKFASNARLINPNSIHTTHLFQKGALNENVLKPVYIARRPHSIPMLQHHNGNDRIASYPQYHTNISHPTILSQCLPHFEMVNIQNKNMSSVNISAPEQEKISTPARLGISEDDANQEAMVAKKILKKSRRSTIGEKPYSCEVCGKRFAFVKKFIAHKRIHIVGKLFSCYLCHKRFGYSYKLNQHMRLHTDENLEKCDLCKKTYKNLGYLRRHRCKGVSKKIIHPKLSSERSSYACTVCHRTFGRINYLNLHKRCHEDKRDLRNRNQERFLPMESITNPLP